MIYVRSKEGSVLMPTERCGKIGYLLRHGKAHVVSRVPFVVQLDYDSTTYTQDVSLVYIAGYFSCFHKFNLETIKEVFK